MKNKIKFLEVEYIDKGTFVGGEEEAYDLDENLNGKTELVVIKKSDFDNLIKDSESLNAILNIAQGE